MPNTTSYIFSSYIQSIQYVLLKALPPICMKHTARDESRVANIARGEAEYICHKISSRTVYFHTNEAAVF